MDVLAQCGTTVGRGKDGVDGGKGEVDVAGLVMVMTVEQAVVKGVAEREGHTILSNVCATTGTVGVVTSSGSEAVGVCGSKGVVEEELQARAKEAM